MPVTKRSRFQVGPHTCGHLQGSGPDGLREIATLMTQNADPSSVQAILTSKQEFWVWFRFNSIMFWRYEDCYDVWTPQFSAQFPSLVNAGAIAIGLSNSTPQSMWWLKVSRC
ncbi:hypothetical protein [Cerasicoccus maritimus]|uniref:hypothetical protein n=1 Tax=Cerasicoccus maritimus TaxID=490089 RepID=UPI002852603E|nr:hypothetical protein [Cerasicoccus maritimus]